jgi:hypothetical protein
MSPLGPTFFANSQSLLRVVAGHREPPRQVVLG